MISHLHSHARTQARHSFSQQPFQVASDVLQLIEGVFYSFPHTIQPASEGGGVLRGLVAAFGDPDAIAVARGQQWWTAEQIVRVWYWREEVQGTWESLTKRERAVLMLIAAGQSNQQIAEALTISENTVETHVGNLLGKLAVASRTAAATWVWRHGLTEGTGLSGGNQPEKDG